LQLDGENIQADTLTGFRQAIAAKYHRRFPSRLQYESSVCQDKQSTDSSTCIGRTAVRTGLCDDMNNEIGSYYAQLYNKNGAYVLNNESSRGLGHAAHDDIPYYHYEWGFAPQIKGGPGAIVSIQPIDGNRDRNVQFGTWNTAKYVDLSDDSKSILTIEWSSAGVAYLSRLGTTNKEVPATPAEKAQIDRRWARWLAQRGQAIAYGPGSP
jgi:hypothetical protein